MVVVQKSFSQKPPFLAKNWFTLAKLLPSPQTCQSIYIATGLYIIYMSYT